MDWFGGAADDDDDMPGACDEAPGRELGEEVTDPALDCDVVDDPIFAEGASDVAGEGSVAESASDLPSSSSSDLPSSSSGSASSSASPAAPAPCPPLPGSPQRAPPARPRRAVGAEMSSAVLVYFVPGGKITMYTKRHIIECVCENKAHGKCVLTRSMLASTARARTGQGRPVGLAVAWLARAAACETKADHWTAANWPSLADRKAAREVFKTFPGSSALLNEERSERPAEDSEPEQS